MGSSLPLCDLANSRYSVASTGRVLLAEEADIRRAEFRTDARKNSRVIVTARKTLNSIHGKK